MRLRLHDVDPDDLFFTGDTHFNHKLMLRFRPFESLREMDKALIANINEIVGENQVLVHVGDFGWGSRKWIRGWRESINCRRIYYVPGNHCKNPHSFYRSVFTEVSDLFDITVGSDRFPLTACHYAMTVWNRSHYGAWHVHGHSHGNLPVDTRIRRHDVGVDNNDLCPVSWQQLEAIMADRKWVPLDHHGFDLENPIDNFPTYQRNVIVEYFLKLSARGPLEEFVDVI